ncbi:MAG TPA: hypothetical protein VF657_04115, partial [Actinoplanes sp.]
IGVPGEDYGTALDAGAVHYLRSAVNAVLHAGSGLGVSGSAEIDDRVGYSLASSPYHLAIGSPGEALGSTVWAGVVHVFGHELVNGLPKVLGVLGHDNGGGTVDPFDSFGESISMVGYRPAGAPAGQPNSLLVVGVPGDDVGDVVDAGALHRYQVTATGYTHLGATTAATPGVGGDVRAGDYFGRQVRVINTQPDAVASPQTVQIAVGVPGRDVGGVTDAGSVDVFAGVTDPITPADLVLDLTVFSTPLNPNTMYGAHLGVSPEYLFVAHSEAGRIGGAVNGYEWAALAAGRKTVSMAFNDGIDGIPRNGTAFGWAIG